MHTLFAVESTARSRQTIPLREEEGIAFHNGAIEFSARKGEAVVITSASETTRAWLANVLSLSIPSYSSYSLFGESIAESDSLATHRHLVGSAHVHRPLVEQLTVAENLEVPLAMSGFPRFGRSMEIKRRLAELHLLQTAKCVAGSLPIQQQRVLAVAKAVMSGAPLIVVEDPLANLTPTLRRRVSELLSKAVANGTTVIAIASSNDDYPASWRHVALPSNALPLQSGVREGVA